MPKINENPNINMEVNVPEEDHEAAMARSDLYKMAKYSMKLFQMIEEGQQLEGWVQAKITKASDYISSIYHYMEYQMKFGDGGVPPQSVEEITGEPEAEKEITMSEEDDEEMKESNTYHQRLQALLESAKKKEMSKKSVKGKKAEEKMDEAAKPDFLDVDGDGDTKEPMKKAAKQKGGDKKVSSKGMTAKQKKLPAGLQKAIAKKKGVKEAEERRAPAKKQEREVELPSGAKVKATKVQGWQSQRADKEADKAKKADEALDLNLIKSAQKGMAGKTLGKQDAESDKNVRKPYGYRGADGSESDDAPSKTTKKTKEKVKESAELDQILKLAGRRPLVG
jgi:hypothetical protein